MVELAEKTKAVSWTYIPHGSAYVNKWSVYILTTWEACSIVLAQLGEKHNKPQFDNNQKDEQFEQPLEQ